MRFISIVLIVVFFKTTSTVFGQWTDLTSTRNDIVFINESVGWMGGGEGSFLKTTDGGKTWINQNSPIQYENEQITKIAVFDGGNTVKIVTRRDELSALYITSDGGVTWKRVAFNQSFNFDMHFISSQIGWYWVIPESNNNEPVFYTTDGGNTWTEVPGLVSIGELTSSGSDVWAVQHRAYFPGEQTVLWHSSDLGVNWTSSVIDPLFFWEDYLPDLQFFDSQNGWLCTKILNGMYKTTDGGESWLLVTDAIFDFTTITEIFFVNKDLGFAYGYHSRDDQNKVFRTTDGGATWKIVNARIVNSNASDDIRVFYFINADKGVAAGDNGLYMETNDGGNTWEIKNHCTVGAYFPANDITFNNGDVWVVGENLVQTSGDGTTWKVYENLLQSVMYEESAIAFRGDGKGIMVTDMTYLQTIDNGVTWYPLFASFEYSGDNYNSRMWYDKSGNVWIVKANATLYKSEDDGKTFKISWRPSLMLSGSNMCMEFQTEKKIWYYGQKKLIKTLDGGITWSISSQSIQQLQFISEDVGFKLQEDNKIYKTIDGGENWAFVSSIAHWSPFKFMFFADENVGWVGSQFGIIMKTIDGGKLWTDEHTGMLNEYYDMAFSKNSSGEIVGYIGGDGLIKLNSGYTPQPVTNLGEVVASITSSSELYVNLEWTDTSTIEDGFIIQRKISGGTYSTIGNTTSTTFNDNTVELGVKYFYRVGIYKTGRAIHYSNEVTPRASQLVTFQEIPQKAYGDPAFALFASCSSGLPLTFTSSDESIASIADNIVTIHGAGEVTITASATENANFLSGQAQQTLVIKKANQVILFGPIEDQLITDPTFQIIGTSTSGLTVEFTCTSDNILVVGNTVTLLNPGIVTVYANQPGNSYFNAAPTEQRTFCISPSRPIITATEVNFDSFLLTSSEAVGNQWYKDGTLISGETSISITVSESGSYTVVSTIESCSSEHSETFDIIVADVVDIESSTVPFIYPNPAIHKTFLNLSSWGTNTSVQIQILDTGGREIANYVIDNKTEIEIDINSFEKGLYIVRAATRERRIFIASFMKL